MTSKTRVRWEGKVRFCERHTFFGWKTVFVDDFSSKPDGYPVPPPSRMSLDTIFGPKHFEFPWQPSEKLSG